MIGLCVCLPKIEGTGGKRIRCSLSKPLPVTLKAFRGRLRRGQASWRPNTEGGKEEGQRTKLEPMRLTRLGHFLETRAQTHLHLGLFALSVQNKLLRPVIHPQNATQCLEPASASTPASLSLCMRKDPCLSASNPTQEPHSVSFHR